MGTLPTQTYHNIDDTKIPIESLRNKLKLKTLELKQNLQKKYPHVEKFFLQKGIELSKLREHSAKIIGAGALTSALLLGSPSHLALPQKEAIVQEITKGKKTLAFEAPQEVLLKRLAQIIPSKVRPLSKDEEKKIEGVFQEVIGVNAKANLEGEHLNTTYGLIGAEQHLRRYPGDSMATHPTIPEKDEGMAPGLGAWGYFSRTKGELTPDLVETEKWYAVVQTLYLPDWQKRLAYLREWYKYRKVLIVNTNNGKAVVAAIADSGPAAWTGKVFGGSPEVMYYLGGARYKKGPVILFFVDDPENKVHLGPVEYSKIQEEGLALKEI